MENKEQSLTEESLQIMATTWPSAIVPRSEVGKFTGNLIAPSYMANVDARGDGPPYFRTKRKVFYRVPDFIRWLVNDYAVQ